MIEALRGCVLSRKNLVRLPQIARGAYLRQASLRLHQCCDCRIQLSASRKRSSIGKDFCVEPKPTRRLRMTGCRPRIIGGREQQTIRDQKLTVFHVPKPIVSQLVGDHCIHLRTVKRGQDRPRENDVRLAGKMAEHGVQPESPSRLVECHRRPHFQPLRHRGAAFHEVRMTLRVESIVCLEQLGAHFLGKLVAHFRRRTPPPQLGLGLLQIRDDLPLVRQRIKGRRNWRDNFRHG